MVNVNGTLCTTEEELEAAIAELPEDQKFYIRNDFYGCANPTVPLSQLPVIRIQQAIADAMAFGQKILIDFRAENVAMGVLQDNMTGWLLNKLSSVMDAVLTGSLTEAIARLKAIPTSEYDGKYMTVPRMIQFINKIEVYLGVPLTTELN